MATTSWSAAPNLSTAALFNAFFLPIATALAANGWTQTADTGQVNLTTNVTLPVSPAVLYQIWRDSSQATFPIYLRIEFSASGNAPRLNVRLGSATDGAGNITGNFTQLVLTTAATASAASHDHFGSVAAGRAWFMLSGTLTVNSGATTSSHMFIVERSKDSTGADTDEFATLIGSSNTGYFQQSLHKTNGATGQASKALCPIPLNVATNSYGGYGGVFGVFPALGRNENPMMDIAISNRTEQTDLSNISVYAYGVNRTMKCFTNSNTLSANYVATTPTGSSPGVAMILRYE